MVYPLPPKIGGIFIALLDMPVDLILTRASSIPGFVQDPISDLKAGITGSDILWEAGRNTSYGDRLPLEMKLDQLKQSWLYVGITRNLYKELEIRNRRKPKASDLRKTRIATKFPNITRDYFKTQGVEDLDIVTVAGTDEAMQFIFPNCYGILGVLSTKKTIQANRIEVVEVFYKMEVRIFKEEAKMSSSENQIFEKFKAAIMR